MKNEECGMRTTDHGTTQHRTPMQAYRPATPRVERWEVWRAALMLIVPALLAVGLVLGAFAAGWWWCKTRGLM